MKQSLKTFSFIFILAFLSLFTSHAYAVWSYDIGTFKVVSGSDTLPSSGTYSGPTVISVVSPCENVAGTWNVTEFWNVGNSCGLSGGPETYPVTITQNGCNLTINDEGIIDTATINGNTFSYVYEDSGFNPDVGGILSVVETITVTVSGNSYNGSSTWDISIDGVYSCSGISTYTGTKQ